MILFLSSSLLTLSFLLFQPSSCCSFLFSSAGYFFSLCFLLFLSFSPQHQCVFLESPFFVMALSFLSIYFASLLISSTLPFFLVFSWRFFSFFLHYFSFLSLSLDLSFSSFILSFAYIRFFFFSQFFIALFFPFPFSSLPLSYRHSLSLSPHFSFPRQPFFCRSSLSKGFSLFPLLFSYGSWLSRLFFPSRCFSLFISFFDFFSFFSATNSILTPPPFRPRFKLLTLFFSSLSSIILFQLSFPVSFTVLRFSNFSFLHSFVNLFFFLSSL